MPEKPIPFGRFELVEPVGSGGMGRVWRARHRSDGTSVAVKVISEGSIPTVERRQKFRREVQAQAAMYHPAIVRIHDHGTVPEEAAARRDGLSVRSPFLAMEFAEAGTLGDDVFVPDWPVCREVLLCTLDALAHAHARGVIHCDLKPANVLYFPEAPPEGRWKLADFGIAHTVDETEESVPESVSSPSAGTPHYMAPEQWRGRWRWFEPWTDLYQLGCVAYHIVCGRRPYEGSTMIEIADQHLDVSLPEFEPRYAVPEGIEGWIRRLMRLEPEMRYRCAADAARDLVELDDAVEDDIEASTREELVESETLQASEAETEVEVATRTLQLGDATGDEERPDSSPSGETSGSVPRIPEIEVPEKWREERRRSEPGSLRDVGLSLFGLREVPFVDRDSERDAIWQKIRESVERQRPRAVIVRGNAGTGKSHLTDWMARRGAELGVCTHLRAVHERSGRPLQGLAGAVERWAGAWELEGERLAEHLEERLRGLALLPGHELEVSPTADAAALAELIRPSSDPPLYHFDSREERFTVLERFVRRLHAERPVVLALDDLHWDREAAVFAERLLGAEADLSVTIVATVREERAGETPEARGAIERLEGDVRSLVAAIEPLEPEDQVDLVREMLPVVPELARRVQRRTEGHPLFAVQLVGDWVARGLLEPSDAGYRLRETSESPMPEDIFGLWTRRLEKALEDVAPEERDAAMRALEIAAALGRSVDRDEWAAACRAAALEVPEEVVEAMIERGLASPRREGWRFAHGMLLESLERRAKRSDAWKNLNRICAEMLVSRYPDSRETARRRAEHWIEAEAFERALEPLREAAKYQSTRGGKEPALHLLERRGELLERLSLAPEDRRRIEQWVELAHLHYGLANPEISKEFAERARAAAESHEFHALHGNALLRLAILALVRTEYERSEKYVERAEESFERAGDDRGLAKIHLARGYIASGRRRYDEALRHLERARRTGPDDYLQRVRAAWQEASILVSQERLDEAETAARKGVELAREHHATEHAARFWNLVGEVGRSRGEHAEAREAYERAIDLWRQTGSRDLVIGRMNAAVMMLLDGEIEEAEATLRELEGTFRETGFEARLPLIFLGLGLCAASRGDWELWEDSRRRLDEVLDEHEYRVPDHPEIAAKAAERAREAGADRRADEMFGLAARLWEELDEPERARSIRNRIDDS